MKISVVVPTYRRPADLERCLVALSTQIRLPDQVVVVHRADDLDTIDVLTKVGWKNVDRAVVSEPGAVAAYNLGLDTANGEIIAIIDDDTRPHENWLSAIEELFFRNSRVGGLGGRDIVHIDGRPIMPSEHKVGIVQLSGRMIGNHHIGLGPAREVDILKGANMSFRRDALNGARFDRRLRGQGAQVHLEVGICTQVLRNGWKLVYDPAISVDHFPSIRHDYDKRNTFSESALIDKAHNETLSLLDFLPKRRIPLFAVWCVLIGTRELPGLLHWAILISRSSEGATSRFLASWKGRMEGLRTWKISRM